MNRSFSTLISLTARIAAVMVFFLLYIPHPAEAQNFQITNINDINLGSWNGVSNMTGNDPVCVYKSSGNASYRVTATDNSTITPTAFRLQNTANTREVPYVLNWSSTSAVGTLAMTDGVARSTTGANRTSQTCGGGTNANFSLIVAPSSLSSVPAGTYTVRITLMVRL